MAVQLIGSDIEAKVSKCDACAPDLKRTTAYGMAVQLIGSDIEAKVSKCDACAADLKRKSTHAMCSRFEVTWKRKLANAMLVSRI